jgi:hypothetical protein
MSEKRIEQFLVDEVKRQGGQAFKFVSPGMAGATDRLVLLPVPPEHQEIVQRYVKLVEVKDTGEHPRPLQIWFMKQVQELGHFADWVSSRDHVRTMFK